MPRTEAAARRNPKSATLIDVAQLARVSVSTASKALNGRSDVAETTRERVVEAARRLNFVPNTLAKSLQTGRSGTVGLITHDFDGRFSIPLLMGAEDAFGVNKVSVLLCDARGDAIRERYHLDVLMQRRVDGLIIVGARPDTRPTLGRGLPVPVVYAYAPSDDPEDCSIVSDNVAAGDLGVSHLLAAGRRHVAIIAGDTTYGAAVERVHGAKRRLSEAGLESLGGDAFFGSWTEPWGRAAMRTILTQYPEVDGVLCGNDQIARGALDTLRDEGRRVPDDVSVVGHDNWEILATGARPTLTSIEMNLEEIGRLAAQRLAEAMEGNVSHGVEYMAPHLVVRASSVA
ncbi:LacI family DNA-binding transcriptional regulator [Tessaracoccus palaemonis]|uniref:LacI family DNA-binding transcriptional regulator n=1 Tax=Tessaracoccus palaemonis TaxID=2829499 RepID=UPI002106F53C|nr:LacI family DNA-binding transcriptional regulator [Tessaracoccus palaemonis]